MTTWNYKTQAKTIRHVGPMAQDFTAAFHVGENDTTISTVDEGGVALAAIQGLNQKVEEQKSELKERDADIRQLKQSVAELKQLIFQLRQPEPK
jgi:peptidoglycan hydrolase CwlO-like protein